MKHRPRLLITMGDVAGIGPEIIAKAWPALADIGRPTVVGDPGWLRRALDLVGVPAVVHEAQSPGDIDPALDRIPCLRAGDTSLGDVVPGRVSAAAGRAAFDFLCRAIDLT